MHILSVVGARPQFVKLAPVHRELSPYHQHQILHTGQHYDYEMSQAFFEDLGIPDPDVNLEIGSGLHGAMTGRMLTGIEERLMVDRPDMVLVYGDTNSTLAAALAAAKLHIPIAHVEAGLRSYNRNMPEEINRVLTDHVSDLLFCPSQHSSDILSGEGVREGVHVTGDVMVQALLELEPRLGKERLQRFDVSRGEYVLVTAHRQENVDDPIRLRGIVDALSSLDGTVVFPVHPRTRAMLERIGMLDRLEGRADVRLVKPLDFITFTALERYARVVLTDSGGVQKEAYTFQVPCVTMRNETEWTETVDEGWNVLVGTDTDAIVAAVSNASPGRTEARSYGGLDVTGIMRRIIESRLG